MAKNDYKSIDIFINMARSHKEKLNTYNLFKCIKLLSQYGTSKQFNIMVDFLNEFLSKFDRERHYDYILLIKTAQRRKDMANIVRFCRCLLQSREPFDINMLIREYNYD